MPQQPHLLYQRYRSIALVVYTAVLGAGVVDWLYGGIGPRALVGGPRNETLRFLLFGVAVLVLVGLELKGAGKASFENVNKVELSPFVARLFFFLVACAVTDLNYSQILFLPILLYSYLAVSKRLSFFIAFVGVATLFGLNTTRIDFMKPPPPPLLADGLARPRPATGATQGGSLIDS